MSDLVGNPEDRFSHVAAHFQWTAVLSGRSPSDRNHLRYPCIEAQVDLPESIKKYHSAEVYESKHQ